MAKRGRRRTRSDFQKIMRRNIAAAGWVGKFGKAMLKVLNRQLTDVVGATRRGEKPGGWLKKYGKRWERELTNAKRDMVLDMTVDGYMLATKELDKRIEAAQAKTLAWLLGAKAEPMAIAMAEEELKRTRLRANVEAYINETSKLETRTSAARYGRYHKIAAETGMTSRQMAKLLLVKGAAVNKTRARLMAETTTNWAYNEGATESYKDAGVGAMEWLTALGQRTCDQCSLANGEQRPIGETFSTGVEHPPAHPLCRCATAAVVTPEQVQTVEREAERLRERGVEVEA